MEEREREREREGGRGREREREREREWEGERGREVSTQSTQQSMIQLGAVSVVFSDDISDYKEDSSNIVCSVQIIIVCAVHVVKS